MRPCIKCGIEIPVIRLEALPLTETCVKCSTVRTYKGSMDWQHKTAPDLVMVNPEDRENLCRAQAISDRRR